MPVGQTHHRQSAADAVGHGEDVHRKLHPALGPRPFPNPLGVRVDRRLVDSQHGGDLTVTEVAEHQLDHFGLPLGEADRLDDAPPLGGVKRQRWRGGENNSGGRGD
jgi:hypothetical protein